MTDYVNKSDVDNPAQLLEIGSCVLHIVHGGIKTAQKDSKWNLTLFLRSLYYLFKDFPTRRAVYIVHTKSSIFPLKFCSTRWLENSPVINRAIDMLAHLKKYVKAVEKHPPKSVNFDNVKTFLKDELLETKLNFIMSVIVDIEPFLAKYQTDLPMLPFMRTDLFILFKTLMNRIIKRDIMKDVKNVLNIMNIDLSKKDIFYPTDEVDIGFGASSLLKKSKVKELDKLKFKTECRQFIFVIIKKLKEKSLLSSKLLRGASCLSPEVMLLQTTVMSRVDAALSYLVEKNRMNAIDADRVKKEYHQLISSRIVQKKLKEFDRKKDRLDTFLMQILTENNASNEFTNFLIIILILFHANAAVERGFSYNKGFLVENLYEDSLIAQRCVHDAIRTAGGIKKVQITKEMIKAFTSAYKNKKAALAEKSCNETKRKESKARTLAQIQELDLRRRRILENAREEADHLERELQKLQQMNKN